MALRLRFSARQAGSFSADMIHVQTRDSDSPTRTRGGLHAPGLLHAAL